ncbi:rna binding effector protein [Pyrenophora tritici-repentis]|nr:rna binding effector protein [Pyrenophora tritici-repentis]
MQCRQHGTSTPIAIGRGPALPSMNIPGKHTERISLATHQVASRAELKKPINEIVRDINRRSKAKLEYKQAPGGLVFEATGPVEAVRQALKEVANEVGSKVAIRRCPVPCSVRAHIIGRQGSKIQEISKRTGARINVPKPEAGEDEDTIINVHIEGNALTAEMARREIDAMSTNAPRLSTSAQGHPAEFYPFLAGPNNVHTDRLVQGRDVNIQIPTYHHLAVAGSPSGLPRPTRSFCSPGQLPHSDLW